MRLHASRRALIGGFATSFIVATASVLDDVLVFAHPIVRIATMLIGSGLGFVAIAAISGWLSSSYRQAIAVAVSGILTALVIYYVATVLMDLRPGVDLRTIMHIALVWSGAGAICGVIVGPVAFLAHHGTRTQRSMTTGFSAGLVLGPVIGHLLRGGDVDNTSILIVLAITSFIATVIVAASIRRTNPLMMIASAVVGVISAIALYFVIYTYFY